MSNDIFADIANMHKLFGVHDAVDSMDAQTYRQFLRFRINTMLQEEFDETKDALKNHDAEELVDGLIDVIVIAVGTLDLMGVEAEKAWNEVLRANASKEVGIKEGRPNPYGLPDLIKPEGWVGPNHGGNHGRKLS